MCPSSRSDRRPGLQSTVFIRYLRSNFANLFFAAPVLASKCASVRPALVSETLGSTRGSRVDQRISEAMGCCSMDTLVSGCCCCNAAIVLPPKIGCRGDIMVCCADVTCCFDLCSICNPGACCCCGPTCKCNATLCKLKCTVFCFDVQGSCPCDSDSPIICTPLPFCTIYPRRACCATRASIVKKPTASDAPKNETMDRGSPPRKGLQVV